MKIFVLGIPHTQTTTQFTTCAFTMKVWNLCAMMHRRGHEVIHLGTEGSNPECTEHVSITPYDLWKKLYGPPGTSFYNLNTEGEYRPYHDLYIKNARKAIQERLGANWTAILAVPWGGSQRTATENLNQPVVESGIGYRHTFSFFRVFESYAWMHFHFGLEKRFEAARWYDCVIPNAFDPEMFRFGPKKFRKDHFLFMGRLNDDKGVGLAAHVTKHIGAKLLIVGQGDPARFLKNNPHVTYLPPVGIEERKKLFAECKAAFVPSFYLEPFAGVAVEAQMSGCPVITTDWGVFAETCQHGYTGFRCRSFEHFVWAAKNIHKIDNMACRNWALENYSRERVALMYEEYFQQVLNLKDKGFYQEHPGRTQLDWLQKNCAWKPKGISLNIKHVAPVFAPPPPPAPPASPEQPKTSWEKELEWESKWWGLDEAPHWQGEIKKQETYARLMGLPADLDMGQKRILDVGCGPVSMLLRAKHGESYGLDPLPVSEATKLKYAQNNIKFIAKKAEELELFSCDEVWMYNCLQHTENPGLILTKIAVILGASGAEARIFEWLNLPPCPGHHQTLTLAMFEQAFPKDKFERFIWNTGCLHEFGGTVTNEYFACHVKTKAIQVPAATAEQKKREAENVALTAQAMSAAAYALAAAVGIGPGTPGRPMP